MELGTGIFLSVLAILFAFGDEIADWIKRQP